jgi:hypothetical protein
MSNPQQPELARSRKTPAQDPDSVAGVVEGERQPGADAPRGPVPPDNQAGHHPAEEQDKPDLDAFAERLGVADPSDPPTAEAEPDSLAPTASRFSGALPRVAAVVAAVTALLGVLALTKRRRSRGRSS